MSTYQKKKSYFNCTNFSKCFYAINCKRSPNDSIDCTDNKFSQKPHKLRFFFLWQSRPQLKQYLFGVRINNRLILFVFENLETLFSLELKFALRVEDSDVDSFCGKISTTCSVVVFVGYKRIIFFAIVVFIKIRLFYLTNKEKLILIVILQDHQAHQANSHRYYTTKSVRQVIVHPYVTNLSHRLRYIREKHLLVVLIPISSSIYYYSAQFEVLI